ncbi:MAG: prefoldin subunit alpha [archaeon]
MEADYEKIRNLEIQMRYLQDQLNFFQKSLVELSVTENALNAIMNMKEDSDVFFPISSGVFAKGILLKSKEVLVDLGVGAYVEKPVEEALELTRKKKAWVEKQAEQLGNLWTKVQQDYFATLQKIKESESKTVE